MEEVIGVGITRKSREGEREGTKSGRERWEGEMGGRDGRERREGEV